MRAFALRAKVVNIAQFSSAISFTLMRGKYPLGLCPCCSAEWRIASMPNAAANGPPDSFSNLH